MSGTSPFDVDPHERIAHFLRESRLAPEDAEIVPLTADASDRRYVRVVRGADAPIVLALHAAPIAFDTLPFANVAELLHRMPVPAPEILGHSDTDGILALTDLGDCTLQAHLTATGNAARLDLYEQAVSLIDTLQRRGRELAADRYVPYRLAFDVEKLTWELDFFQRHFLEAHRGARLSDADTRTLTGAWADIATELAAEPRVLCHRDYHSRNLMLHQGRLHLIDFQDARLGPGTYDLASLLRDSYVELPEKEVDALIAFFLELQGPRQDADREDFRRRFDLMAVQRNLKALGTFGYQAAARQNAAYLQYVPRTLHYVGDNLRKYPRFKPLHSVLARYVEELALT